MIAWPIKLFSVPYQSILFLFVLWKDSDMLKTAVSVNKQKASANVFCQEKESGETNIIEFRHFKAQ